MPPLQIRLSKCLLPPGPPMAPIFFQTPIEPGCENLYGLPPANLSDEPGPPTWGILLIILGFPIGALIFIALCGELIDLVEFVWRGSSGNEEGMVASDWFHLQRSRRRDVRLGDAVQGDSVTGGDIDTRDEKIEKENTWDDNGNGFLNF